MTKYFVSNLCEEGEEEMFLESWVQCNRRFSNEETVMSLACGAAAEQGNAFYMSDKDTWPCT